MPGHSAPEKQGDSAVIGAKNPAQLSAGERLAEIGSLLARGFRRARLSGSKCLDETAPAEPSCDLVNETKTPQGKEVA